MYGREWKLINTVPFFKTSNKIVSSIGFEYDLATAVNKNVSYAPDFKFSKDKKTLYVPLIAKNNAITGKYLVYKFNGYHFVYDKNAN